MKTNAALLGIFGNIVLFLLKIVAGLISGSLVIISDALNSFGDIAASIIVHTSVKVSGKKADREHPFGHERAEPIAALIVAVFTGMLGFTVLAAAATRLFEGAGGLQMTIIPLIVLGITVITKLGMFLYTTQVGKKSKSPAIHAMAVDHRNDVLISSSAMIAVVGTLLGYAFLDALGALLISIWILYSAWGIAKDNLGYLMGQAPARVVLKEIREDAARVPGVIRVMSTRAHYVGLKVHVEVSIGVDPLLSLAESHEISELVRTRVEFIPSIGRAFIHVEPCWKKRGKKIKIQGKTLERKTVVR